MLLKITVSIILSLLLPISGINCFAKGEPDEKEMDRIDIQARIEQAEADGHRYAYMTQGDSKLEMVNGYVRTNRWNANEKGSTIGLYQFETIVHQGKRAIKSTASDQSNIFITLEGSYWQEVPKKEWQ